MLTTLCPTHVVIPITYLRRCTNRAQGLMQLIGQMERRNAWQ